MRPLCQRPGQHSRHAEHPARVGQAHREDVGAGRAERPDGVRRGGAYPLRIEVRPQRVVHPDHDAGDVRAQLERPRQLLTLDIGGRQSLDKENHLRLLFMGGRAIQAVTPTNGEPNWIAYLGVKFLLGPKESSE